MHTSILGPIEGVSEALVYAKEKAEQPLLLRGNSFSQNLIPSVRLARIGWDIQARRNRLVDGSGDCHPVVR